jgi:hypothetical protein
MKYKVKQRQIAISKGNLMWNTVSPLMYCFLVIWGVVSTIFIIAAATSGTNIVDALIGSGLFLVFMLIVAFLCSLYMIMGLSCIKKQEEKFSIDFNREMENNIMQHNIYIDQTWYVCIASMRLFAFRKGYLKRIVSVQLDDREIDTIVCAETIDCRVLHLSYSCGNEDRVKALEEFIQN